MPRVRIAVGCHPHNAKYYDDGLESDLRRMLKDPRVAALGEIGLDYHYDFSPREVQKAVFDEQLSLAEALDVPVIIHSREASADTLEIVRRHRCRGVIHCFSGSVEMAKEVLKLGMYIGFTGVLTFKNARKAVEVVQYAPADRLLIETDCPYMAPEPLRGRRCDSTMLQYTLARMAELKGLTPEEMTAITWKNACAVYGLPE